MDKYIKMYEKVSEGIAHLTDVNNFCSNKLTELNLNDLNLEKNSEFLTDNLQRIKFAYVNMLKDLVEMEEEVKKWQTR